MYNIPQDTGENTAATKENLINENTDKVWVNSDFFKNP